MTRAVDRDLENLRKMALRMGGLSEAILAKAWLAVQERNQDLSAEVRTDDLEIDRMDVAIDAAVLRVLALQAPVARDLREVIAIKTAATDLERVGDIARNIATSALRLNELAAISPPSRLEVLADASRRALLNAVVAFANYDSVLARAVLASDDQIDADEEEIFRSALHEIRSNPDSSEQEVYFMLIAKNLERVGDHATNVAEEVILVVESLNLKHAEKLIQ